MKLALTLACALTFTLPAFAGPCDDTDASAKEVAACVAANKFRAEQNLPALTLDSKLNQVARAHAVDMVNRGYFDHNTPEGATPSDRLQRASVASMADGENIAQGQETGVEVVEAWKASPGHRENLVQPNWNLHGMGEFRGTWVHVFIQR